MKSTGEVMGIDREVGMAFAKSQLAAGQEIPLAGSVFLSVRDADKEAILPLARELVALGFDLVATKGTAAFLQERDVPCSRVYKISEGRPHIKDKIENGEIAWIVNTSLGTRTTEDSYIIRRCALDYHLPYTTTVAGAQAMLQAIAHRRENELDVQAIQDYYATM